MGDTNTKRIEHNVDEGPNTFRTRDLKQIINDLAEEDTGKGFSEILKVGPFVSSLITWADNTKTKKRTETVFNRTGVFVNSIVKEVFDEDNGTVVVSTTTVTFTRNGSNQVIDADVVITRP